MNTIDRQAIRSLFPGVSDHDLDEAEQHLLILEQEFPNIAWRCKWQGNFVGVSKLDPEVLQAEVVRIGGWRMTIQCRGMTLRTPSTRRNLRDCLVDVRSAAHPLVDALAMTRTLSPDPPKF